MLQSTSPSNRTKQPDWQDFFACHLCLKISSACNFSNAMMKGKRGKLGTGTVAERARHLCIPCGIAHRIYPRGTYLQFGGGRGGQWEGTGLCAVGVVNSSELSMATRLRRLRELVLPTRVIPFISQSTTQIGEMSFYRRRVLEYLNKPSVYFVPPAYYYWNISLSSTLLLRECLFYCLREVKLSVLHKRICMATVFRAQNIPRTRGLSSRF